MSIQEYYRNKNIFITGGTGFIGKCLIEKLLRCCNGIQKIYVLIRQKRGKTIEERMKIITDDELFNKLKKLNPEALQKLVPVHGDVAECKLGLSQQDQNMIIENVNIIYHGAASVRFDDYLKDSILLNTRGTREIVELALKIKNLEAFVHLSTAYCHLDRKCIEEKLYRSESDWRNAITIAENMDRHSLDIFSNKYIEPFPNTYTFTKCLAEDVVADLTKGKIPTVIIRPSTVCSTVDTDPECGWTDNFNNLVGLQTAISKGILKVTQADKHSAVNFISVDVLVKMIILGTYERFLNVNIEETMVYNATFEDLSFEDMSLMSKRLFWDCPPQDMISFPWYITVKGNFEYFMLFMIYQLIPALLIDILLKLSGREPRLYKIQKKMFIVNNALTYFMQNNWLFDNKKATELTFKIPEEENSLFSFNHYLNLKKEDVYVLCIKSHLGVQRFLLKEKINRQTAFNKLLILWVLNYILHIFAFGIICWFLLIKMEIFTTFSNLLHNYTLYLKNL